MDCGDDEDNDFFNPITGNFYSQEPAKNVNYEFSEDKKGLFLWINENHKLVFSKKVLSVEKNQLENAISFYPNPTKEIIHIDVKTSSIKILNISIIDSQGREIIKKSSNFQFIDLSKISKGIYFLKITSDATLSFTKKIIKE